MSGTRGLVLLALKVGGALFSVFALLVGGAVAIYIYDLSRPPTYECYGISNADAERMIASRLDEGFRDGRLDKLYEEKSISEMVVSTIDRGREPKGDDWYVKLVLINKDTGKFIVNAYVFEDCDMEWWGGEPSPDTVVGDIQAIKPHVLTK